MTASTDTFKIIESIDGHTGGNNRPVLIASSSTRKQCPLPPPPPARLSRGGGNPWVDGSSYLDRAGSVCCIKGWSRRTLQSPQCKSLDSTRIDTGQSSLRGRARCLTHFIAWQRRRREPGSNSVIVTASLTRCEGHVEGRGGLQRMRKILAGCPAIRPIWDQSPGIRNPRFETVGNRLYPLHGQIRLCCSAAEAQIQDRSRAKTGPNTAPGFLRVSPSFPRRREPREKQSTPPIPHTPPLSQSEGGPSDRSERSDASGGCPGLNPFPRSQRMPTPPSPSMRGNNSGFEIVSMCGRRADQRLVR